MLPPLKVPSSIANFTDLLDFNDVKPGELMRKYYFDDLWIYNHTINQWVVHLMKDEIIELLKLNFCAL